jgi:hypothetical protein
MDDTVEAKSRAKAGTGIRLDTEQPVYRKRGIETMATDFQPAQSITATDLFGGRLEKHGVREIIIEPMSVHELAARDGYKLPPGGSGKMLIPGTTEHNRCLTDGTNYMWVKISSCGFFVSSITRYGGNDPQTILKAIAEEFDTDMYSEHDAEFWEGYECEPGRMLG